MEFGTQNPTIWVLGPLLLLGPYKAIREGNTCIHTHILSGMTFKSGALALGMSEWAFARSQSVDIKLCNGPSCSSFHNTHRLEFFRLGYRETMKSGTFRIPQP